MSGTPPSNLYTALLAAMRDFGEVPENGATTGKMVYLGQRNKSVAAVLETPRDMSHEECTPMTETQYTPLRLCNAPGCDKPRSRKSSYCPKHASRLYHFGSFDLPQREKYRVHPIVDEVTGCHNWPGATDSKGYGKLGRTGYKTSPHRWYWIQRHGEIPAGMQLDHLCRNRRCCNPDHLEPVTNRENQMRGMAPNIIAHRENRCRRGHEMTPDNVYRNKNGGRTCRTCALAAANRRYAQEKAAREQETAV